MKLKLHSLLAIVTLTALVGCASFNHTAGKALASAATSVDATMKGWAAWVAAGKSNPQQEANVKQAYGQYQVYMDIAKTAYVSSVASGNPTNFNSALTDVNLSVSKLTATVQSIQLGK